MVSSCATRVELPAPPEGPIHTTRHEAKERTPTLLLRGRSPESAQRAQHWLVSGGQVLIGGDDALLVGDMLRRSVRNGTHLTLRMIGEEILVAPPTTTDSVPGRTPTDTCLAADQR